MKLYYSPGACSLSPHIVLREAGLKFEPVQTSTKTHKLQDGTDFYTINARGYVPVLELDNGERLTEGPAIVQYLADQVPAKNLAPAAGTMARGPVMIVSLMMPNRSVADMSVSRPVPLISPSPWAMCPSPAENLAPGT